MSAPFSTIKRDNKLNHRVTRSIVRLIGLISLDRLWVGMQFLIGVVWKAQWYRVLSLQSQRSGVEPRPLPAPVVSIGISQQSHLIGTNTFTMPHTKL